MLAVRRFFTAAVLCLSTAVCAQDADNTAEGDIPNVLHGNAETAPPDVVKNVKLSNLSLGFVNFRRIMATAPQLNVIRQNLDAEFKDQQNALQQAQTELENLERKVEKAQGDADYDSLTQQLITKRRDVARQEAQLRDDYSVRRNEEIAKLQTLVLNQIVGIAKEQGFDVILNDNGVLYVSEHADLTDIVIERLSRITQQPDRHEALPETAGSVSVPAGEQP